MRKITEVRDDDNRCAEDVFVMDEVGIGGRIGVALSFESESVGVLSIPFDADDAVGDDGFLVVSDVRNNVADLESFIVSRFDINERADGEFGFHGAGHDSEGAEASDF